ncbi:hypothetical protein BDV95DRAFT_612022 [Massariosphaeria phaeospora]|uniref:Uncharacterized protein n=1 Tax=Massariosphaeria phaeospora TaxID=100035 RepID=A0A7C8HZE0_9PLEO|nr:hypothetical protein BDV95DRAFT_612022 [Massariosphaeria phaeospora]
MVSTAPASDSTVTILHLRFSVIAKDNEGQTNEVHFEPLFAQLPRTDPNEVVPCKCFRTMVELEKAAKKNHTGRLEAANAKARELGHKQTGTGHVYYAKPVYSYTAKQSTPRQARRPNNERYKTDFSQFVPAERIRTMAEWEEAQKNKRKTVKTKKLLMNILNAAKFSRR